jgi:hypothetical protein
MFTSQEIGMREAVTSRHPDPRWKHTGTYSKGMSVGPWPIDGVYVTPDLPIDSATWLQFIAAIGDHRFAVIDVQAQALVGDHPLKIVRPPARRLSSALPSAMAKYTRLLTNHMSRHKVLPKLHELYLARDGDFTPAQRRALESLDRVRTEGMIYAKRNCHKLAMGNVSFSPEVDKTRALWHLVLKKRNGKKISSSLVRRKARQLGILCPLSVTLAQAEQLYQEADGAYDEIKKHAHSLRHEFLCDRAVNKSGQVPSDAQKAAQRLLTHERQRNDARHLKRILGKTQGGAISRIEVEENGEFVEKTSQAEVEQHTMEMCDSRFHLTQDTPFMQEPLRSALGPLAVHTQAAREIMEGVYQIPPACDEFTRDFLETVMSCSPIHPANRISCVISKEDFQYFWRGTNERTSSLISSCHYGHYKVAAKDDALSEIHALFTELAVTGGSPLSR